VAGLLVTIRVSRLSIDLNLTGQALALFILSRCLAGLALRRVCRRAVDRAGSEPESRRRYRAAYGLYDDQQFNQFNFTRIDLEARHKFAVFGPHRRLTLHGWVATTEPRSGNIVPFYMQPTLGGGQRFEASARISSASTAVATRFADSTITGFATSI
jgi:hypothetical protein